MSKSPADQAQDFHEEEYRRDGFRDARNGVYRPEAYAKGWARDAYRAGKEEWVAMMAQER